MQKSLRYSLFLLSVFVILLTTSSANAALERKAMPLKFIFTQKDHIIDWQLMGRQCGRNMETSFAEAAAADFKTDPTELSQIIKHLGDIRFKRADHLPVWQHETLPCTWCICKYAPPILRYTIILLQVKSILERYPPATTDKLVHTSFAEEGLLQTYCLVYTLAKLDYHDICVNVIGNKILEEVATRIPALGPLTTEREKQIVIDSIQAGFSSIKDATGCNIEIRVYKSAYDYITAVSLGLAPRSMSFDMIDSGDVLNPNPIIYSPEKLPESFQDDMGISLSRRTVCSGIENLGQIGDYKDISIYYGTGMTSKKSGKIVWRKAIYQFSTLEITKMLTSYTLAGIMDKSVSFIHEQDVSTLIGSLPALNSFIKSQKGHPICVFLQFNPKPNIEIFTELIQETCVEGKEPIAFELNGYIYI